MTKYNLQVIFNVQEIYFCVAMTFENIIVLHILMNEMMYRKEEIYMKVIAVNVEGEIVPIDDFFAVYREFVYNNSLVKQTARFLKMLTRNYRFVEDVAQKVDNGYAFEVHGETRSYNVFFEVRRDAIVLKKVI